MFWGCKDNKKKPFPHMFVSQNPRIDKNRYLCTSFKIHIVRMSTLSLGKAIYRSISFYSLICTATVCSAISLHTDTLQSQQLSEVVIEAENQRTSAAVSTYIPATRQKNAAQNAVSLLGLMAIPQLDVDLASLTVKTIAGQQVAIFIDYNEATPQDLDGLRTQDVKRVELYNHPTDARFKGARHVVNFIMQKYEYGGYTKVKAAKQFCVNSTDASLYSKMAYKSMTYDIYADESYLTDRHGDRQYRDVPLPGLVQ